MMNSTAQTASVFGNDNIIVQASGSGVNVTVGFGQPYLRLTQYENRTRLESGDTSDTALLSAYRADVIQLIGRDRDMDDLQRWLDDPAVVCVRVLIGPGGRGKTRLALELARTISKDGWLAGFVTEKNLDRFRGQHNVAEWRWDMPALLIIDYAASRAEQIRDWLCELIDAPLEGRPKLRLLLLERQANRAIGWLTTVCGLGDTANSRAAIALLNPPEPVEVASLDDIEFRREVFATLLERSGGLVEAPGLGDDPEFDFLLTDSKWAGDPLYLMMAGLAAAKKGVPAALRIPRADLALSIARNELDRIGRIGAAHGIDAGHRLPGAFVRHMAVLVTLVQGLTLVQIRSLATTEREAFGSVVSLDATIAALVDALPESAPSGGVAAILPDIIGEAAILAWLGPDGALVTNGLDPQARIASGARVAVAKASSTLVRTALDFAAAGYAEPIHWLETLTNAPETDLGALMQVSNALPDSTLALREFAAALTQRIVATLRGLAATAPNAGADFEIRSLFATSLNNLGFRLGELGRREEAVAATSEASEIYRRLGGTQPNAFLPYLAGSLSNLGVQLSELGRSEEALVAAQEATGIHRTLAAERPDGFLPNLAGSLNNLGSRLSALGRHEEALAKTREAVDIYRSLVTKRSDTYLLPHFAGTLNNLGNCLSRLGHREEALAVIQEATEIYRRLAAERPDAFLPGLALFLGNLSVVLHELGWREDSLNAAHEAVEIRRRLAHERPDAFLPDLAISLNNFGVSLSEVGRSKDALAAAREATDVYRNLAAERPSAFLPDLAGALNNLGNRLSQAGHHEEALATTQEATGIYRTLAAARPDAFLPDFAASLDILGNRFGGLSRRQEALVAAQEAIGLYRRLATERPGVFSPHLARSLGNLGIRLSELSRQEEALAVTREAAETLRPFFLESPSAFASWMRNIARQYLQLTESLGVEPDAWLLGPIIAAFLTLEGLPNGDPSNNA